MPHKFGFHMFTGHPGMSVTVTDTAGAPLHVDLDDWIVTKREDIDWGPLLAPAVCRDMPRAADVTVRQWGSTRVYSC